MDTGVSEAEPSDPEGLVKKYQSEAGAQPTILEENMDEETELDVVNKVNFVWLLITLILNYIYLFVAYC
jgi:hypothetical protein